MSIEERLAEAERLIAEVRAELAEKATKSNWPEKIEAGMVFRHECGCVYMVISTAGKPGEFTNKPQFLAYISGPDDDIGNRYQNEGRDIFGGDSREFTYLGHARDILAIRTDAHEPTGAELVGKVVKYYDMDAKLCGNGLCVGYDHESANPYKITGGRGWFNNARVAA